MHSCNAAARLPRTSDLNCNCSRLDNTEKETAFAEAIWFLHMMESIILSWLQSPRSWRDAEMNASFTQQYARHPFPKVNVINWKGTSSVVFCDACTAGRRHGAARTAFCSHGEEAPCLIEEYKSARPTENLRNSSERSASSERQDRLHLVGWVKRMVIAEWASPKI